MRRWARGDRMNYYPSLSMLSPAHINISLISSYKCTLSYLSPWCFFFSLQLLVCQLPTFNSFINCCEYSLLSSCHLYNCWLQIIAWILRKLPQLWFAFGIVVGTVVISKEHALASSHEHDMAKGSTGSGGGESERWRNRADKHGLQRAGSKSLELRYFYVVHGDLMLL